MAEGWRDEGREFELNYILISRPFRLRDMPNIRRNLHFKLDTSCRREVVSRLVWGECCFGKNTDFQKLPTHPALLLKKEKTSLRIHVLRILLLFSPPLPSFQIYISISKEGKSTPLSSPLPISLSFATFHLGGALNYEHHLNLVFTATRNSSLVSVFQPHLSPPFFSHFKCLKVVYDATLDFLARQIMTVCAGWRVGW